MHDTPREEKLITNEKKEPIIPVEAQKLFLKTIEKSIKYNALYMDSSESDNSDKSEKHDHKLNKRCKIIS